MHTLVPLLSYCFDEMEGNKRGKKIFKYENKAKLAWLILFLEFSFKQNVEFSFSPSKHIVAKHYPNLINILG